MDPVTCPHDLAKWTTILISNKEMNDIMKIVMSHEEYGLLIKGVRETNKNEGKEQKRGFLAMLLDTSGASLLGNLFTDEGLNTACKGTIRTGQAGHC